MHVDYKGLLENWKFQCEVVVPSTYKYGHIYVFILRCV